ncbi:thioesterase [Acidocella aquatica]|uniref:Thioesterase n=2 Tax=Acidocella aquatica TaxID=1922313 RepID=A0ABQ6ACA7_9PROT|nr:thioesterase [Acidocella aquatica]
MARIDRPRLDAATFPIVIDIQTRYDDIDMQGHVNNAAAIVILQEARAKFNVTAGLGLLLGDVRAMVAALNVEYAAQMHYPEPVQVHIGVLSLGRTSFTITQVARQNGRSALYAEVVMVIADANGPTALPTEIREAFQRLCLS